MICPYCGQEYSDHPALSRTDNSTLICPRCGSLEALIAAGFPQQTIDEILATLYPERNEE